MKWYTSDQMQAMANKSRRPVLGWRPTLLQGPHADLWIHDRSGKVADWPPAGIGPRVDGHSIKCTWRPQ
jgi:hypothetical protein